MSPLLMGLSVPMLNLVTIDIVIPVLNEEETLTLCVEKLVSFCDKYMGAFQWRVVIADNGSQDKTVFIAQELSLIYSSVSVTTLLIAGRGRALKKTWMESDADLVAYMDVDLSTDINALPKAADYVLNGEHDIVVGSRLLKGSRVVGRTPIRSITSWSYSCLFRLFFLVSFKDAQCGFKVLSRDVVDHILPSVRDPGWFFDTELLILAEKNGFCVFEMPVLWIDDPDSRVKIFRTAWEDLKGLVRLRFGGLAKARGEIKSIKASKKIN